MLLPATGLAGAGRDEKPAEKQEAQAAGNQIAHNGPKNVLAENPSVQEINFSPNWMLAGSFFPIFDLV